MRITQFKVYEKQPNSNGLHPSEIRTSSNKIAIVGKNGSGKTRFLKLIKSDLTTNFKKSINKNSLVEIPQAISKKLGHGNISSLLNNLIILISPEDFTKNNRNQKTNPKQRHFTSLIGNDKDQEETDEYEALKSTSLAYFENLATDLIIEQLNYSGKPDSSFKKTKLYQSYKSLSDKFESLIEKKLEFRIEKALGNREADGFAKVKGIWLLNERKFKHDELSDGEKTLFRYILLLFLQENYHYSKTKNSIILIDEPEIHLHPEAQIKLIKGLEKLIGDTGQLIVATHSLTILSLFNYDEIYLAKSAKILGPNSNRPEEALNELIGDENRITYLTNLFHNISSWGFAHFMLRNFSEPDVIESSSPKDPQFLMFLDCLKKNNLKFLDFGAGKGRLIKLISDSSAFSKFQLIDAFDVMKDNLKILESNNSINSVHSKLSSLPTNTYDLILVSNVLHEIPPKEIPKSLNKLKESLSEKGILIILEDLILRKGEMPNETGYLVFNEDELKTLLSSKVDLLIIPPKNPKHSDRLLCGVISKENIGKTTLTSLKQAITQLKSRAYSKSLEFRKSENYAKGRTYAFYVQQYMNAEIYLNEN